VGFQNFSKLQNKEPRGKPRGIEGQVLKAPATDSVALKNEAIFEVLDPK
jgi:hypothetical protein